MEKIPDLRFAISDICTAFNPKTIGSKVIDMEKFFHYLGEAVEAFDWNSCRVPGQAKIKLSDSACACVSCGIGLRVDDPSYYLLKSHRGVVSAFLKREYAEATKNVFVIVYTTDAFLKDPDVTNDEAEAIKFSQCTHVIIAVLATPNDEPKLGTYRFVHNLAGGNNEALTYSADEIRSMAKEIIGKENKFSTVADI